jgi:hypothetical protein
LTTLNTPALTTATACSSADTGVGATIAAGSQRWKGISAALPMPNMNSASRIGHRPESRGRQDAARREVGRAGDMPDVDHRRQQEEHRGAHQDAR